MMKLPAAHVAQAPALLELQGISEKTDKPLGVLVNFSEKKPFFHKNTKIMTNRLIFPESIDVFNGRFSILFKGVNFLNMKFFMGYGGEWRIFGDIHTRHIPKHRAKFPV